MSTKFLDGPASGITLALQRAPTLLRVVRTPEGHWDALDLLDDAPEPGEEVTVYRLQGTPGSMHLHGTKDGKRWGRWEMIAEYQVWAVQPDAATTRSNRKWREWCKAQVAKEKATKEQAE